jgi:hypothetical protein
LVERLVDHWASLTVGKMAERWAGSLAHELAGKSVA